MVIIYQILIIVLNVILKYQTVPCVLQLHIVLNAGMGIISLSLIIQLLSVCPVHLITVCIVLPHSMATIKCNVCPVPLTIHYMQALASTAKANYTLTQSCNRNA